MPKINFIFNGIAAVAVGAMLLVAAPPSHAETAYEAQKRIGVWCLKTYGRSASARDNKICRVMDLLKLCVEGERLVKKGRTVEQRRTGYAKCTKAAQGGVISAGVNLGQYYLVGIPGVIEPNHKAARHWLEWGYDQGHPTARANLGLMYLRGAGGPANFKKGKKLILASAHAGDIWSQTKWASFVLKSAFEAARKASNSKKLAMDSRRVEEAMYWSCRAARGIGKQKGPKQANDLCKLTKNTLPPAAVERVLAQIDTDTR